MLQDAIVDCARGYIGTSFHHQGRLRKTEKNNGGIDCLGLLVGIAGELQLQSRSGQFLTSLDELSYSHQPDTKRLIEILETHLYPMAVSDIRAGDIALFRIDHAPQHMGVISCYQGGLGLIHAYAPARKVVEHQLDDYWRSLVTHAFSITG